MAIDAINSVQNVTKPINNGTSTTPVSTSNEVEEKSNGTTLLLGSLAALAVGAGIYALTKGKSKPSAEATKPVEQAAEHAEQTIKQQIAEVKNLIDKYKDFPKKYLTCPKLKSKDTFNSLKDIPFKEGDRDILGGTLVDSVKDGINNRFFIKGNETFNISHFGSDEPVYFYTNKCRYFEQFIHDDEVTLGYKFAKGSEQSTIKSFTYDGDGKLSHFSFIRKQDGEKPIRIYNNINKEGLIKSGKYTSDNSTCNYQFTDNKLSDLTLISDNKETCVRFNPNEEIISCTTKESDDPGGCLML
jgi:hypothetical protein